MSNFRTGLLALLLLLGLTGAAFGHAALVSSEPGRGSVIVAAPATFTLRFNEPVSPLVLNLVAPDGTVMALTGAMEGDGALHIPAPEGLGRGTFILSYRVMSVDGHPVGGTVSFSIGAPGGTAGAGLESIDWPLLVPIWAARLLVYAGLFLGVGGSFFRHWLAKGADGGRRAEVTALILGIIAAALSVGLQGLDALDLPLSQLVLPQAWATGAGTTLGLSAGIAAAAMVLALASFRLAGRALSLLALLGVGLSLMATGHASSADPHWLTRTAIVLHGTGIAFWAGALLPLRYLLKSGHSEAGRALDRFGALIPVVLVMLVGAGVTLALIQLGDVSALLLPGYGRVLLVKLVLVALLLGLGAINRWRLAAVAEGDDIAARRPLLGAIAVETMLFLVVFGVVALWRFTPPPRASVPPVPVMLSLSNADLMAEVVFDGKGTAAIGLMSMGAPLNLQGLTLVLSNPTLGIEAMSYAAEAASPESWQVHGLLIPAGGDWTVQVEARVSDFQMSRMAGQVELVPSGSQ